MNQLASVLATLSVLGMVSPATAQAQAQTFNGCPGNIFTGKDGNGTVSVTWEIEAKSYEGIHIGGTTDKRDAVKTATIDVSCTNNTVLASQSDASDGNNCSYRGSFTKAGDTKGKATCKNGSQASFEGKFSTR